MHNLFWSCKWTLLLTESKQTFGVYHYEKKAQYRIDHKVGLTIRIFAKAIYGQSMSHVLSLQNHRATADSAADCIKSE